MGTIRAIAVAVLLIVIASLAVIHAGAIDVAASRPHSGIVDWLLSTAMQASVKRNAAGVTVPDLDDVQLQKAGVNDFDAMCAGCHGAPGKKPQAMGQGLNPAAPDLAEMATQRTAAELFWVTKHGIRMTGMPSWGASHDDDALWPVVAFMKKRLPDMDAAAYQKFISAARGAGHHAVTDSGDEHEHGANTGHDDPAQAPETANEAGSEHDHSSHEH